MIVDGYSHCGILKYQPVEVVLDTMAQAGVDRAVLCQHLGEYDNSYLAQVVGSRPQQFAAVLLVNPSEPGAAEKLRQWSDTSRFRTSPAARRVVRTLFSVVARGRSTGVAGYASGTVPGPCWSFKASRRNLLAQRCETRKGWRDERDLLT